MTQSRKNLILGLLAVSMFAGLVIAQQSADSQSSQAVPETTVDANEAASVSPETQSEDDDSDDTEPSDIDVPPQANVSSASDDPTRSVQESEENKPAPGLISKATMEEFVPSEEISDDRSVSYPNDI